MYIMDSNQYATELMTYAFSRNAIDSIAFFSQCNNSKNVLSAFIIEYIVIPQEYSINLM